MRLRAVGDDTPTRGPDAPEHPRQARLLEPGDRRVDPLVVAAFDAEDPITQAARQLRGHLVAAHREDGGPVRMVAIAGVDAHAEAAALAANLAVVCAQAGYRTLLVDAVLSAPSQHQLLRVPNRTGVSTLLAGGDDRGAIQNTAIAALSVLPAGPARDGGEQLFDRARLFERLRGLIERYDLAIVLVPGDPAHAAAACEGLDGALLLARRDVSDARTLDALAAGLAARGTPLLGIVGSD